MCGRRPGGRMDAHSISGALPSTGYSWKRAAPGYDPNVAHRNFFLARPQRYKVRLKLEISPESRKSWLTLGTLARHCAMDWDEHHLRSQSFCVLYGCFRGPSSTKWLATSYPKSCWQNVVKNAYIVRETLLGKRASSRLRPKLEASRIGLLVGLTEVYRDWAFRCGHLVCCTVFRAKRIPNGRKEEVQLVDYPLVNQSHVEISKSEGGLDIDDFPS